MSDEQGTIESQASPEQRQQALDMGWIPPERFKGDPSRFIDAGEFIEKGESFVPFLKADRERLKRTEQELRGEVQRLQQAFADAQTAIESLKEFQTEETKRQVKEARRELQASIREAREAGDVRTEMELTDKLDELKEAQKESPRTPFNASTKPREVLEAEAWVSANASWWNSDDELRALTIAKANKLQGTPHGLSGHAFYDECARQARETLYGKTRQTSKVEGSGGGSGGGNGSGGGSRGKSFKDLPASARDFANDPVRLEKMVGPGRPFKTNADWHAHFAKHQFTGDE